MSVPAERVQPRRRGDRCGARGIGNEQIGATVAMMVMMAARKRIAGLLISGRVTKMLGVIGMAARHGMNGEISRATMVMRHHDRRRMPDLIHGLCRHRCRIDRHQQHAQCCDQTVQAGQPTVHHDFACRGSGFD